MKVNYYRTRTYHTAPLLQAIRLLAIWPVQLMIRMELRKRVQRLTYLADHKVGRLGDPRAIKLICYLDKGGTVKSTKKKRLRLILGRPNQLFGAMRLRLFRLLYWAKLGQYT